MQIHLYLENQLGVSSFDIESVENRWKLSVELHVNDGTDDSDNLALNDKFTNGLAIN